MKKLSVVLIIAILVVLTSASSCKRDPANEKRYDLKGKIVAIEPEKNLVTIAHEEVKDFMPAMTMPFTLRDQEFFNLLAVGDDITATLVVNGAESWIENPIITRQSADTTPLTGVAPAKPGDEVPDYTLVNQDEKDIRLHNYRGKALLITFIYTRCPLPEYCDLMSNNFAVVNRQLGQQPDVYSKIHLMSITIDPEYDTPKVLRSYGAAHTEKYQDEKFDHWEFATGTKDQIKGVAQFFGLRYFQGTDQILHNLSTVLIGTDGKIIRVWSDNKWKPEEVVAEMQKAVAGT